MRYSYLLMLIMSSMLFTACAAKQALRPSCANELNAAWEELDVAKAQGFSGTVSYTKAAGILSLAKTMQTVENFDSCIKHAKDARYYIAESKLGR